MKGRTIGIFVILTLIFATSVIRVYSISTSKTYSVQQASSSYSIDISHGRGMIYDYKMQPLVNEEYEYIAAIPPTTEGFAVAAKYNLTENQKIRLSSGYPVTIKVDRLLKNKNVKVFKIPKRYSTNQSAVHLIGHLNSENKGIAAIESSYNDLLTAGSSKIYFKTDARGKILTGFQPVVEQSDKKAGGVVLTIDKNLQKIAEASARKHLKTGAVVVLENETGKIRAMVSLPDYSPLNLAKSVNAPNSPFINRALTGFNCGSAFKLCIAAAAIENGIDFNHSCVGSLKVQDITFNCLKVHGNVNLQKAIAVSCNTFFIQLGQKLGADCVYNISKSFAFGMPNTLSRDIVGAKGRLSSQSQLKSNPAALANISFGQGDLLTTPLQIASMIQCICNNGKQIKPSLIEGITDDKGNLTEQFKPSPPTYVIKKESAKKLMEYMVNVVEHGTGASAKPEKGGAGGKTATAETGMFVDNKNIVQAWFVGFFPAESPKYTLVVLAENGVTGGQSAAPVFKEIIDNFNLIN